jgi:DNA repair protein RecO (recombination protein O)
MNSYKTEGVVLKRSNFGEADRLITLFTKHYGKVTGLAKGIRKITSRKRGALEIFNQVIFFAAKGKGMEIITEAEVLNTFSDWRKDLKKVAAAYEVCEILDKLTVEGTEQEEVYRLLVTALKELEIANRENLSDLIEDFAGSLLKLLGFWPKEKPFPPHFCVSLFVEEIIERELKSKRFLKRV